MWTVTGALLATTVGCSINPVSGDPELSLLSETEEIALGAQEHPNILGQYGRYSHAELQEYISRIGQELARKSHRKHLKFTFTLLDSNEVNAFALPGGYIYITRGLLAYLNSEDELAAVLGHEIGHVTARHSVRQISASKATSIGVAIGSLFVPELNNSLSQNLLNTLSTALLRGYGREHELEADRLGAEYLARTGRHPSAMLDVIRVLKNQEQFEKQLAREENREPRIYHGVFSTHPDNDTRLQETIKAARKFEKADSVESPRAPFVRRLEGLVFGASAEQGLVQDRQFLHKPLDFALELPKGWSWQNSNDRLLAIAPNESALLQLTLKSRNKGESAQAFLKRHTESAITDGQTLTIGDFAAYHGLTILQTQAGAREARVAAIVRDDSGFLFIGVNNRNQALGSYQQPMDAIIRSYHVLSTEERQQAQPLQLALIEAEVNQTFRQLAKQARLKDHAEEYLRLLNAKYPRGEPAAGQLIKLVK